MITMLTKLLPKSAHTHTKVNLKDTRSLWESFKVCGGSINLF